LRRKRTNESSVLFVRKMFQRQLSQTHEDRLDAAALACVDREL
jgi:hypothetical protein